MSERELFVMKTSVRKYTVFFGADIPKTIKKRNGSDFLRAQLDYNARISSSSWHSAAAAFGFSLEPEADDGKAILLVMATM